EAKRDALWQRGLDALSEAADRQAAHQADAEPAGQFVRLIAAALSSGRCHLDVLGGWDGRDGRNGEEREPLRWRAGVAQGKRIGWAEDDDFYLEPESAFAAAQSLAGEQGSGLPITARTLWQRLKEKRFLATWDDRRQRCTVRKTIGSLGRLDVLHF